MTSAFEEIGIDVLGTGTIRSILVFIVAFIVVFVVGRAVLTPIVARLVSRRGFDEHVQKPIMRVSKALVVFLAFLVALGLAGLQGFLLALAGVAAAGTLAVGIALQDVIRNFVSGIFIYIDEPFRIGDWIEWDDRAGVVMDIRLRTTQVRTFDNELLTVPNADLTENVVKNPVAHDKIRQRFTIGIGFDDDISEAIDYMIDVAEEHPDILDDPEPSVRLTELGDSAVLLQSRVWIANPGRADFIRIRGEYGQQVKQRFDEEGIDIPFPIRTLDGEVVLSGDLNTPSA